MQSNRRIPKKGVIKLSDLNMCIFIFVYFILAVEYDLYNFFNFGALISGATLTFLEILFLLFVIITTRRFNKNHLLMYVFLFIGIFGTYIFNPNCIVYLQMFFFEGSSLKKVFLLPLAAYCIKEPKIFMNRLYAISMIEGYLHIICNAVWGYGYTEWGVFNYMTYGMALITPTCLVMFRMFSKPSKFNVITFVLFELNIIVYAHRGALLVTMVMMLIFFVKYVNVSKKSLICIAGTIVFVLFILFKTQIIQVVKDMMNTLGLESRTLEKLLSGDITNDSERKIIWAYMASGIMKDIPFGHGIGADRLLLANSMREGLYAHNFILEICYDYGIVIGLIVIVWIFKMVYNCLTKIDNDDWYGVLIIFLVPSVITLLTSASIYQYWLFWLSLGFYYCYLEYGRKNNERT